ncbi:MAG: VanW family protein [Clostridia bacterium]|nr:VanW family protein [Clostridia bacterium]
MYEVRGENRTNKQRRPANGSMQNGTVRDYSSRDSMRQNSAAAPKRKPSSNLTPEEIERRRRARQRKLRRRKIQAFAILTFFLLALAGLIVAIIFATKSCSGDGGNAADETPAPSSDIGADISADTILPAGASVNGVSVEGLTVEAATAALNSKLSLPTVAFALQGEGIDTVLDAEAIGAAYDIEGALALAANGRAATATLTYSQETLKTSLYAINDTLPNHATNASFTIETNSDGRSSFNYVEGTNGMQIEYDPIIEAIEGYISQNIYSATIVPQTSVSTPAVTVEDLKQLTTKLASYTTTYRFKGTSSMTEDEKENCQARDANIQKAVAMMNVITLEPGEVFSFNNTTGNRDVKYGWTAANAVYNGIYRKEGGGGVCQITTTMFNALMLANVEIVNRKAHTLPSDYVDLGLDATVDYGNIDFKFRNNGDTTLYVFVYLKVNSSSSRQRDIIVEVYGKAFEEGVKYRTRYEIVEHIESTEIEYEVDKSLEPGDDVIVRKPHDYYLVMSYVDKYVNGEFVETVMSFESEYKLYTEKHLIGPTAAPTTIPTPAASDDGGDDGGGDDGGGGVVIPNL